MLIINLLTNTDLNHSSFFNLPSPAPNIYMSKLRDIQAITDKAASQDDPHLQKDPFHRSRQIFWYGVFFFFVNITQWIYYIYSCTMTITTQFYSISLPQPQCIPLLPKLSPLETISFSKSVSQYLFCKEVHCVLFSDSTCQWYHSKLVSHCLTDFT